jgi:hypothetical protein
MGSPARPRAQLRHHNQHRRRKNAQAKRAVPNTRFSKNNDRLSHGCYRVVHLQREAPLVMRKLRDYFRSVQILVMTRLSRGRTTIDEL